MRKTISILIALLTLIQLSSCSFLDELVKVPDEDSIEYDNMGGGWVMDECHLVDYKVKDDKIAFEYSFCYYYDDTYIDKILQTVMVSFGRNEMSGWLKNNKPLGFLGIDGKGNPKNVVVHPYEKNHFTLFFIGDYLGGEINMDIKPTEINYSLVHMYDLSGVRDSIRRKVLSNTSPDGKYIVTIYTGGSEELLEMGLIGELVEVESKKTTIIYYNYPDDNYYLHWIDNTHVQISDVVLDVTKDTYDFRR